ncbi:MAG: PHB depolymerase family esterase [Sphingobium sp.]|nr:PHB depolymerase family esterase [Sphingobium sp.]
MKKLAETVAQLAAMRSAASRANAQVVDRLDTLERFGSNPGRLSARSYVPDHIDPKPALVVVLHGCTQTAAGYDMGSGWSRLADRHGFALLFPEQQRANNPNLCFNWFSPDHSRRDRGEALSIRQMIAAMVERYDIDPARIYITGLSAGGAMTSVMLAAYPQLFAGGAIIAGLPYGSASSVGEAFTAMQGRDGVRAAELGDLVRRASGHAGPWPRIAIWHGTADPTVNVLNADRILSQWLSVHDLEDAPSASESVAGHARRVWKDEAGQVVVEDYRIAGMGHGTPLAATGAEAVGVAMPHMLEAGISSTTLIAASWDILKNDDAAIMGTGERDRDATGELPESPSVRATLEAGRAEKRDPSRIRANPGAGVQKIIEDALRAAGLTR